MDEENPVSAVVEVASEALEKMRAERDEARAELESMQQHYDHIVDFDAELSKRLKEIDEIVKACHRSEVRESEGIQKIYAILAREP